MAHNLAITLLILEVYVAMMVTPFVYATKSSASTTVEEHEATKEGGAAATKGYAKDHKAGAKGDVAAKAPEAATKGDAKDHKAETKGDASGKAPEAATKGYAKGPKENAKGAAAEGPGAPMSWPDGGPKFAEMVIKNPYMKTTPPSSSSDGLPIDPTPEGSMA